VSAPGATWIDRQLLAREPVTGGGEFGAEVREAMGRRVDHLVEEGLAHRQGQRVIFARDLLNTLRQRELGDAVARLSAETGLTHRPSAEGEHVSVIYRQRVTLASLRLPHRRQRSPQTEQRRPPSPGRAISLRRITSSPS